MWGWLGFILVDASAFLIVRWVTPRYWEGSDASAIVAAAAICFSIAIPAMSPVFYVASRRPDHVAQAGLGAVAARLLLTPGVAAIYQRWYAPSRATFASAVVFFYLMMLVAETAVSVWMVRRHWRPSDTN